MLSDLNLLTYRAARCRLRLGDTATYTARVSYLHRGGNVRQRLAIEAQVEADGATHLFALENGRLVPGDADMLVAA